VILAYLELAKGYYVKNGHPTGELDNLRDALRRGGIVWVEASPRTLVPRSFEVFGM